MSTSSTINKAVPASQVSAAVTTAQIFPQLSNSLAPAFLALPGSKVLEQQLHWIRAQGLVTTAVTTNVTLSVYGFVPGNPLAPLPASPLVPGSWTLLCTSTARAVNTLSRPWMIELECQFDSVSGIYHGNFRDEINNLYDAQAALAATLTGVKGTQDPCVMLAVAVAFSVANAGNIGSMLDFVLDK